MSLPNEGGVHSAQAGHAGPSSAGHDPATILSDPPQEYRVERDGERDLTFEGWELGHAERSRPKTAPNNVAGTTYTVVTIYVTRGGKYVAHSSRWSTVSFTGEAYESRYEVCIAESPQALLNCLLSLSRGKFGALSREAWNEACAKYPPLAALATERLD